MQKQKVNLGNGSLFLKSSPKLIGVKIKANAKTLPAELTERRLVNRWMGGFRIYKVANSFKKLDAMLDKIRKHRNVLLGTHAYFAEGSKNPLVPTGKVFLIFEDGVPKKDQETLLKKYKLDLNQRLKTRELIANTTSKSSNPIKVAIALEKETSVKHAEPDVDMPVQFFDFSNPPDDLFPNQWHLKNNGPVGNAPKSKVIRGADLKVVDAWERLGNRGSSKITVAIVDSGLDMQHPDYVNKIVAPFSLFNLDNIPTQGLDAISTHGTSCAGLAIAESNGKGIVGVAPNAKLMPVEGSAYSWESLKRVADHCVANKADIISCSWGSTDPVSQLSIRHTEALANIARKGRNGKGCVVLFAVGNENLEYLNHFATYPNVIAVAGSTSADGHFQLSNRGKEISVCAPAGDWPIIASRASWDDDISLGSSNHYKHFEGTSAACPLVAGVCALVLSANPKLTAADVKEILEITADKIGNKNEYEDGHSLRFGYGRVNADKAVAEALRRLGSSKAKPPANRGLYKFDVAPQKAKGFGVQAGVYEEYGNVLIQASKMKKDFGTDIIVNINELNGETVYKVILGAFAKLSEAKPLLAKVKAKGIDAFITDLGKLK